jgi:hypothetical protein
LGQVAVVGQQEQALTVLVETADGVDTLMNVRHQVHGPRPAGGVVVGAQVAARLVDDPIDGPLNLQRLAIDLDLLVLGIDLGAELADDVAVHGDAAAENQLLAVPPRTDASVGQVFVEAFHNGVIVAKGRPGVNAGPNTAARQAP